MNHYLCPHCNLISFHFNKHFVRGDVIKEGDIYYSNPKLLQPKAYSYIYCQSCAIKIDELFVERIIDNLGYCQWLEEQKKELRINLP